ncbi:MAG: type II toxin-antitoxin system HicB family antitoxin [Candidatus Tectomicrobia bacterium]|nr:type II toxin-antitoxin system HicB family antitoxin [Candidatus Tectomicrobia bacterium]
MAESGSTFTITLHVYEEADGFVSHCPEFDIWSQGDTEEEALAMLTEAVDLHIEEAQELGYLAELIQEAREASQRRLLKTERRELRVA